MASYTLIGSTSTTQVLSTTGSQEAVLATILTVPSNVTATIAVSRTSFDANQAAETLTALADNINNLMNGGHAIGGYGTSDLDNSGLTEYFVTFTVGYNPAGAPPGQVTVDVDVPVNLLSVDDPEINATLLAEAEALINDAYSHLVNMANG